MHTSPFDGGSNISFAVDRAQKHQSALREKVWFREVHHVPNYEFPRKSMMEPTSDLYSSMLHHACVTSCIGEIIVQWMQDPCTASCWCLHQLTKTVRDPGSRGIVLRLYWVQKICCIVAQPCVRQQNRQIVL